MNLDNEKKSPLLYLFIMAAVAIILFVLCGGAAYTAVKSARLSAARASIGHVEAVLLLAEVRAEQDGLGPPPETYQNLIKSYDDGTGASLTPYENYILAAMLDTFGSARDFDFAVTRYQDGAGLHTQVYFFPYLGQTDMKRSRYYLLQGSTVSENNV